MFVCIVFICFSSSYCWFVCVCVFVYNLYVIFEEYVANGVFPKNITWKSRVKNSISSFVEKTWLERLQNNCSLVGFTQIQAQYKPCFMLYFSKLYRNYQKPCLSALHVLCKFYSRPYIRVCKMCNYSIENVSLHTIMFCPFNDNIRNKLWCSLSKTLGNEHFNWFCIQDPCVQLLQMLSGFNILNIDDNLRVHSFKVVLNYIDTLWCY